MKTISDYKILIHLDSSTPSHRSPLVEKTSQPVQAYFDDVAGGKDRRPRRAKVFLTGVDGG